jgi:2-oxoglutarate dehydrogenase E2 component (dihydrolipoamide succinyltransferase)
MATEVVMPQMGESIAEGTITKWLVKVGETVERDQPLFEISTDNVDAEIPSPETGVLLEVRHNEGETVPVDEIVAMLGAEGEELTSGPVVATVTKKVEEVETPPVAEAPLQPAQPQPAPVAPAPIAADDPDAALKERVRTHSSPVVRKMAAEAGVEIAQLTGTGIHGRVTKADLERYLADGGQPAPVATPTPAAPAASAPASQAISAPVAPPPAATPAVREPGSFHVAAYGPSENVEIEPMSKIRQITSAHMSYSKATSAHVTTCFDIDLSRVAKIRNQAKENFFAAQGTKLSYMPFIFRAVANALKTNRKLNASLDGTNVVFKKDINLGMAVALDWGLIVPVIKNADQLSLVGLAKSANDLAARARSKKLSPDEVQGGTFTITNPGVFGSLWGTPIINQPQVGILGVGVIEKRPIVATDVEGNDVISIKTMSYFAITYDHRLVDGSDADAFMNDLKHTLATETWNELDPYM